MNTDFRRDFVKLSDNKLLEIVAARDEFHSEAAETAMRILKERNVEYEHLLLPPPEPVVEELVEEPPVELSEEEVAAEIGDRLHLGHNYDSIRDEMKLKGVNTFDLLQKDIDQEVIKDNTEESSKIFWKNSLAIMLLVVGFVNVTRFFGSRDTLSAVLGIFFIGTGLFRLLRPISK